MQRIRPGLAAAALLLAASVQAQTPARIQVDNAWARPTVTGQTAGGAFVRITGGASADRLLAARAPVAKSVELHTMAMDGNVMQMRAIDAIAVPAGQTVELKPGGQHIMFNGLAQPLKLGTSFPLTLRFEKAGEVTVEVQVTNKALPAPMDHADHKH